MVIRNDKRQFFYFIPKLPFFPLSLQCGISNLFFILSVRKNSVYSISILNTIRDAKKVTF